MRGSLGVGRALTLALFGAWGVVGCAGHRAYFAPATNASVDADGAPVLTRSMVPVDAETDGLLLHMEARTYEEQVGADAAFPTVQVRIWVHNDSDQKLELRLSQFSIRDDGGRAFPFLRGLYKGSSTGVVLIDPRSRAYVDVYFSLPSDYDVLSPNGLTLRWPLRVGTREYKQTTVLQREGNRSFRDPFLPLPMGSL